MRMQMQKMLVPPKLALRPRCIHCGQWQWQWQLRGRALSGGPDTVEELLERHLESPSNKSKKKNDDIDDDDDLRRQRERLTSNRREALCLYRDIIRATRLFMWPNDKGILWRDVLRENARSEFEQARYESDPQIIARLLVGGRHALHKTVDMAVQKQRQIILQQQQQHKQNVKPVIDGSVKGMENEKKQGYVCQNWKRWPNLVQLQAGEGILIIYGLPHSAT